MHAVIAVGPEPIAVVAAGTTAYVTVSAAAQLVVVDAARALATARIAVAANPYAIAMSDGRIYVTHLLARPLPGKPEATDDGRVGVVSVIDAVRLTLRKEVTLAPDSHGFPNLLGSVAIAGSRAWVPHVRAAPALPAGLTTTVFAAVAVLDLTSDAEDITARLSLNDEEIFGSPVNDPTAVVPSADGRTLYIVLGGSDLVEVVDVSNPNAPRLVKFLPTGANPRGLAVSRDGRRGYVMNYLGRSVSVIDLDQLEIIGEVPVTSEVLDPTVLRGKILFHNAANPRLSSGSWIACASCHVDSGADGVTWIFPDGPRQTPPLWNAARTLPWHWSAALDEPQDVEVTIQIIQHGLGLAPGADPPPLGAPNAGRSDDLDALAAFLARGIRTPNVPAATDDVTAGRRLFLSAGCARCHGGPQWTSSALPGPIGTLDPDGNGMVDSALHAVGTVNPQDVRGATGFDAPSLLNVGLTAPYFHDGSMPTLPALLASGHPEPGGAGNGLTAQAIADLVRFLNTIGPDTPPVASR